MERVKRFIRRLPSSFGRLGIVLIMLPVGAIGLLIYAVIVSIWRFLQIVWNSYVLLGVVVAAIVALALKPEE